MSYNSIISYNRIDLFTGISHLPCITGKEKPLANVCNLNSGKSESFEDSPFYIRDNYGRDFRFAKEHDIGNRAAAAEGRFQS